MTNINMGAKNKRRIRRRCSKMSTAKRLSSKAPPSRRSKLVTLLQKLWLFATPRSLYPYHSAPSSPEIPIACLLHTHRRRAYTATDTPPPKSLS